MNFRKINHAFFLLALLIASADIVSAQTRFQKIFGGVDSTQDGLDVKQTTDGGYIINARISSYAPPSPGLEDAYILKINSTGTLQWSKRHAGASYEEGRAIVQTTDGGYFYAGETRTWSTGGPSDFDVFATKTDPAGNIQWTHNFGDVWNDGAWAVEQTTDGGYMAFGTSSNNSTNGYGDYYLLKLSNAGTMQWSHTFGGTYFDFGYDAEQTNDGGYIMTGSSFSFGNGYALYTIKADVNGNFQWGSGVNGFADEFSYSTIQTSDGGYIVAGGTTGFGLGGTDVLLVKMTSSGSVSWIKNYGGFQNECAFTIKETSDGGFAVAGGTNSTGSGGYDLFLMKTDSQGGLLWTKTYGGSLDDGFSGGMFFSFSNVNADVSMVNTADGGFALTSQTNSFGGAGHVYLIKTDSNGNSGCNETNGPFMQGVPTLSVIANGLQTNPVQITGNPIPAVTTPASNDTNVCCVAPIALAGNDVTVCQSSSTTLTASGGTSYSWTTGATTSSVSVSPVSTTTYVVTVSDSCGSDKDTVVVTVNALPASNAGSDVTVCPGATVTLNGTGSGTSYVWNPGGQTTTSVSVSPTATTTYTFSASNNCGTANDTVTITVSSSITASVSGNLTICSGGAATLTASGGNNYSWSTGTTQNPVSVSPTSSTTYSVIAYSGSCSDTTAVTVTVGSGPVASVAGSTSICQGGSATLSASGGGTYSWSTGATSASVTVTPSTTTNYSVIVSNGGCTDTAAATVVVTPSIILAVSPASICAGDSAVLSASGGSSYAWSTGASTSSITVSPSATTSYTVTVTSGVCTGTAVATVNVSNGITAVISGNTTVCSGSSATLSASGGTNYSWSTGATASSITISPTSASIYSVIAINGSCSDTASVTVLVSAPIIMNAPGNIICSGASVQLAYSISGGTTPYTYAWSTGATSSSITVNPVSTSNYTLTVTDAAGCSGAVTIPVTVLAAPSIGVTGTTLLCIGDATTLTANGGVTYSWSTGSSAVAVIVSPATNTTYTVIGTDGNGCSNTVTVAVTVSPPPVANISGNDTVCLGSSTSLTASGGGNYLWNTGATSASISVSPTSSTNYSVTVSAGSCLDNATYAVTVIASPVAGAGASVSVSQGQSTTLTASGGGTYSWSNGTIGASNVVTPALTTQYCVFVTNASGCTDSSCVTVFIKPLDCPEDVFVPNAFSPNTDEENEFFRAYFLNVSCVKEFKMTIFNRWGEKLFETTDVSFIWDGIYKGTLLNSAVFTWFMHVTFDSGNKIDRKGNVSLVR